MDRHINRYLHNIKSSIGISKPQGIPIAYIFQPTLLGTEKGLSQNENKILSKVEKESGPNKNRWHYVNYTRSKRIFFDLMRKEFDQLQQNFSKDPLVTIGDLSRIFDNKPSDKDYYGDHVHYSNAGRAVIVKHMMNLLRNPVLIQAQQ